MIETIVIPVLHTYKQLQRCVESIDVPVQNLLVINNGTSKVEIPQRAENQIVLDMPSNLGVGPSWNLGIKCFPWSGGWVFLNSDAWFEPGAAKVFSDSFNRDNIVLAGEPGWCCAWVGDEVVNRIGLFSECYVPAYFEDVDFQKRAEAKRFEVIKSEARVNHENASTVLTDPKIKPLHMPRFRVNQEKHNLRWQFDVPLAGEWELERRRKLGWDAP